MCPHVISKHKLMSSLLKYKRSFKISDFFFFNDTATTEIYTLSLHDALPIYQELRRHDHALAGREAVLDLGLATALDTGIDFGGTEAPVVFGHDHDRAFAGLDHRLGRHEQRLVGAHVHEVHRHEHARHQPAARVGKLHARLQRARARVHLGQDRLHLAIEAAEIGRAHV